MPRRQSSYRPRSSYAPRGYSRPARRPRIYGRGAYSVDNGPWANTGGFLGKALGTQFGAGYGGGIAGGYLGGRIGDFVGRRLFHYPARLFGSGAYRRTAPRRATIRGRGAYSVTKMAPQIPTFTTGKGDYVEIAHREYLGDIISSATAGATRIYKYAITPGESATFPWLASIAQPDFQQFKFEGCMFSFQSFSSDALNSTNTALGAVVAGIDYDFSSEDFTNRSQIENLQWSSACKPSCNTDIPVECATNRTALGGGLLYVLNAAGTPQNVDLKTYMLGKLYILTTGVQGTSVNLGSLYVTYKIRLYKPMIQAPLSNANIVKLYRTGCTNAAPYGTATTQTTFTCDSLGVTFNAAGTQMNFLTDRLIPGSRYSIFFQWVGASTANLSDPTAGVTFTGMTGQLFAMNTAAVLDSDAVVSFPTALAVTDTQCGSMSEILISDTVAQTGARITLPGTGTIPTGSIMLIYITQRNGLNTSNIGYFAGY